MKGDGSDYSVRMSENEGSIDVSGQLATYPSPQVNINTYFPFRAKL